jgi:hypothetical protein
VHSNTKPVVSAQEYSAKREEEEKNNLEILLFSNKYLEKNILFVFGVKAFSIIKTFFFSNVVFISCSNIPLRNNSKLLLLLINPLLIG